MSGEEAAGHCRGQSSSRGQQGAGQEGEQGRRGAVEQNVEQVISSRLQLVQPMVEAEGEDAKGTVGFVRTGMRQRRTPEVIEHQVRPWCRRVHVRIGFYGTAVF